MITNEYLNHDHVKWVFPSRVASGADTASDGRGVPVVRDRESAMAEGVPVMWERVGNGRRGASGVGKRVGNGRMGANGVGERVGFGGRDAGGVGESSMSYEDTLW